MFKIRKTNYFWAKQKKMRTRKCLKKKLRQKIIIYKLSNWSEREELENEENI